MSAHPLDPSATGPAIRRTFVLIPGVGHGGWAWHPVAQRLRAAGHDAVTVTLPGTADGDDAAGVTTDDAVAHVVDRVRARDLRNVVLVAHSWGGYPATAAAHRLSGRVEAVVYVSAVVPRRGVSMTDELPPQAAAGVRAAAAASRDDTVPIPFEAFAHSFMQDEPEAAQRLVFDLLTPTPSGYLLEGVDVEPVTGAGVQAAYVLAEDDRALARPGREFAARLGLEPIMVPGSHEALLTHPDNVARAVLTATGWFT